MTEQEIQETLELLRQAGMEAELCDTPVPVLSCTAACGLPTELGDEGISEFIEVPKALIRLEPTIYVDAKGDSMIDAGIESGDKLFIRLGAQAKDGDIVAASIDKACTIKCIYTDTDGMTWLVPRNKNYKPILLNDKFDVSILGVVVGVEKALPRIPTRVLHSAVSEYKQILEAQKVAEPSTNEVSEDLFLVNDSHTLEDCKFMLNHVFEMSNSKKKVCEELYKLDGIYFKLSSVGREERAAWLNQFPSQWKGTFTKDDMKYFRRGS